MSSIKHFGIPPHLYCLPVVHDLQMDAGIDVLVDVPTRIAIKMRERELEGAFLTPIDYARESSDYCIIPNVAV